MTECTCHPESEALLTRLGADVQLRTSEMMQRTFDHVRTLLTEEHGEELEEKHIDINIWVQEVFVEKLQKYARGTFIVIMYPWGDECSKAFVSLNGCVPKEISYPGPLFFSSVRDQHLSSDFENEEYWKALELYVE